MHLYEQSLGCLCSWVQFGLPLQQLEQLTVEALNALREPQHFDAAVEAVVQIFTMHENYK